MNVLLSVVGFILLIKCADFFVDGAVSLAKNFRVSTAVIGLTIVAFGTSAPELAISFSSHLSGNTDMLFGNVIGSNIANILVILGVAILIKPFRASDEAVKKQMPILLLVTLGASVLLLDDLFNLTGINALTRSDGIILLLFFSVFVFYLMTILKTRKDGAEDTEKPKHKLTVAIVMIAGGLAGIIFGSELVVTNVSEFAAAVGVSQKIIAVTIVSIGTSLPELVTTVVAAKKGEHSMAMGNIVGSNIFNICIVLGLPVAVLGEVSTTAFNIVDIIFLISAVLVFWIFAATGRKLRRYEGAAFIGIYCLYVGYILMW